MMITAENLIKETNKLKDNPLWDYFLNAKHRLIHKWIHYFEVYDKWFAPYRNKEIVMMEIGVSKGGSIQMWKNYFGEKATIIGVDVAEECREYAGDGIFIEIGSQEDEEFLKSLKEKYPKIDILLDDGGHTMNQQIVTFNHMFPHLTDGGLYMCEDIHTSFLPEYGATNPSVTYLNFMKNLVDSMYACYKNCPMNVDYNAKYIKGMHFYDSMIVVEKELRLLPPVNFVLNTEKEPNETMFATALGLLKKEALNNQ